MASVTRHGPKLRSRKDGAAIPLDDLDKRLLNLMQGSFPIAPRPYQHVAAEAGIEEEEAMARVKHLLDERIIRQVTPIFDTSGRSATRRCWWPPRSIPRTRGARRTSSTSTRASPTTTSVTTSSTSGSRSRPSPTHRSGWRRHLRCSPRSPAPSRSASCRH